MKKNNFTQKIFLLILVASITSSTSFVFADTTVDMNSSSYDNLNSNSSNYESNMKAVSPTSGQSKSSNYILDYGTVVNQKSGGTTNTIFIVQGAKEDSDSNVATVKEIDVVHTSTSTNVEKGFLNISLRNLIYLSIGLILIVILIILIIRFFRIDNSLSEIGIEDKNKYD